MKSIFGWFFIVIFSPLIAMIFLCLGTLMLCFLPLIFFIPKKNFAPGDTRIGLALELLLKVLAQLVIIAPFYAVGILFYRNFPILLRYLSFPYLPLIGKFGVDIVPQIDFYIGLTGLIIVPSVGLITLSWRFTQINQIRNLPTAKIASVAMGLAELKGKALPLKGSGDGRPILHFSYDMEQEVGVGKIEIKEPFLLEDESGKIIVDPREVDFADALNQKSGFTYQYLSLTSTQVHEIYIRKNRKKEKGKPPELNVFAGDEIYVIGNVSQNKEFDQSKLGEVVSLKIAPQKCAVSQLQFPDILRLNDVFILSDLKEESIHQYLRAGMKHGLTGVCLGTLLCAALTFFAHGAKNDFFKFYGYVPHSEKYGFHYFYDADLGLMKKQE